MEDLVKAIKNPSILSSRDDAVVVYAASKQFNAITMSMLNKM